MSRLKARVIASLWMVAAIICAYIAVMEDPSGTAENLLADILAVAVVAVAFRKFTFVRRRRQFLTAYAQIHANALAELVKIEEHYRNQDLWASKVQHASGGDWTATRLMRFEGIGLGGIPSNYPSLDYQLKLLAAEYGLADFSYNLERLHDLCVLASVRHDAAMASLARNVSASESIGAILDAERASAKAAKESALRRAAIDDLTELRHSIPPIAGALSALHETLEKGYSPNVLAAVRHPDPIAPWLVRITMLLGLGAALTLLGAYFVPSHAPHGFFGATINNLLATGVAAFLATAFATLDAFAASRHTLAVAAMPLSHLLRALASVHSTIGQHPQDKRDAALSDVTTVVRSCTNQLQHLLPDAQLARYTSDVLSELDVARDRPARDDVLDVSEEAMAALGMPTLRSPSPATMRLIEASQRLSDRAYALYLSGRTL